MSYFKTTRTTTSYGDGPSGTRTVTKTFRYGGDGPGVDISSGENGTDFNIGIGDRFGGGGYKFRIGGGGRSGGCGRQSQRPQVVGRSSRREKKNPFSGVINQSFSEIKKKCLEEGILFEDPEFEANDASIFFSKQPPRPFEWKRPTEFCENPQFVHAGASRFDVQQGELGDCWLLAAVASLTINQKLFAKVVPIEQTFTDEYCGVFCFHFWHQGDWIEVVVDDRLPTYYDKLVFMHSTSDNEFWSALLEKAYAKLMGSYESLKGGSTNEAMEDFTGGVTEMFDLRKQGPELLNIMLKASSRGSLMGCSIDADPNQLEAELENGLIMGHAYSITSVRLVDIKTPTVEGRIPMVRVRNPWGNECEWKGAWSDGSPQWQFIPQAEKENIGLVKDDDGEFWMSFDDFKKNFQKLEICNLGPDSLDDEEIAAGGKRWEATAEKGEWIRNVNAGGCRNYLDTFWTNPQYKVTLTDPDDDEDDLCTVLIGVLQKDRRKKRKEGLDMLTIGYAIYKLKENSPSGPLDVNFFKYNASVGKSPSFINLREVCGRHQMSPGTYVIIPTTFEPHQEGQFLLRIFTEKANPSGEMDEETSIVEDEAPTAVPQVASSPSSIQKQAKKAPPPPTEEEAEQERGLKASFRHVAGEDEEIDAFELQNILNAVFTKEFAFDGFSVDCCRSMVAMHDGDLSGKLGYDEFKILWSDLRKWKGVFKKYDKDNSGKLSSYELRSALRASGFSLSNRTFSALVMRYKDREGQIMFGDFIVCAIRLKTMIKSFSNCKSADGSAAFTVEDFIQTTMYA